MTKLYEVRHNDKVLLSSNDINQAREYMQTYNDQTKHKFNDQVFIQYNKPAMDDLHDQYRVKQYLGTGALLSTGERLPSPVSRKGVAFQVKHCVLSHMGETDLGQSLPEIFNPMDMTSIY